MWTVTTTTRVRWRGRNDAAAVPAQRPLLSDPGRGSTVAAVTLDPAMQMTDATLTAAIGSGPGSLDSAGRAGHGRRQLPNYTTHFGAWPVTTGRVHAARGRVRPWYAAELPTVSDDHLHVDAHDRRRVDVPQRRPGDVGGHQVLFDRMLARPEYNPEFKAGLGAVRRDRDVEIVDPHERVVHLTTPDVTFLESSDLPLLRRSQGLHRGGRGRRVRRGAGRARPVPLHLPAADASSSASDSTALPALRGRTRSAAGIRRSSRTWSEDHPRRPAARITASRPVRRRRVEPRLSDIGKQLQNKGTRHDKS